MNPPRPRRALEDSGGAKFKRLEGGHERLGGTIFVKTLGCGGVTFLKDSITNTRHTRGRARPDAGAGCLQCCVVLTTPLAVPMCSSAGTLPD